MRPTNGAWEITNSLRLILHHLIRGQAVLGPGPLLGHATVEDSTAGGSTEDQFILVYDNRHFSLRVTELEDE
jgi:hypothetical protein